MINEIKQIVEAMKSDEAKAVVQEGSEAIGDIISIFLQAMVASNVTEAMASLAADYVASLEAAGFTREEAVAMTCNFMNKMATQAKNIKSN